MTIQDAINNYKKNFSKYWEEENYKWMAVQHFQDNWNIEAEDFASMLESALSEAYNLLHGGMYYADGMIRNLAKQDPEKVRQMFQDLYNEETPLADRLHGFRNACDEMMPAFQRTASDPEKAKNHYQDLRALCVYLSFRYPDKYFLYKARMYQDFKKMVGFQETSLEGDSDARRYDNFARMCQEVLREVKKDPELLAKQQEAVKEKRDYYSDSEYHLLAQTIIWTSKGMEGDSENKGVTKRESLPEEDAESVRYWIYSPGDNASIWEECYKSGMMAIGWDDIGDLNQYQSKDEMKQAMKDLIDQNYSWKNGAHATWQFAKEMKPGDVVFAKKGRSIVIGRGIVTSDYRFDGTRKSYKNVRDVKWTDKGEWPHPGQAAMKSLTDITSYTDYVKQLKALFADDISDDYEEQDTDYPSYDAENFLEDVYMDEESYKTLVALIRSKKNVILQGAPGVGKTFAAKRLAYSIMGEKDPNRVMMVQFHQSYSYEDFIMGFRPSEAGFELKKGVFYNFCKAAEIDSDNDYFFIIDEINRGNLSKIFGELFMLIENDKRGVELQLLYSDERFSIPKNVYIIGMMNTADRSLAMLDYALRRRFAFFEMKPGFDTAGFKEYRTNLADPKFDKLIHCVENLNTTIATDDSLGEGFCIGHSYFCNIKQVTDHTLSNIVEFELIPLLKEYWFDEPTKVKDWVNNLRSAIK